MLLKVNQIKKYFDNKLILDNLSLELHKKEIICLIGPSGCGKSTILNIICELLYPESGTIEKENTEISYVFQEARLLPWKTVLENIRIVNPNKDAKLCFDIIKKVGLLGYEHFFPSELSGGMKERVSLARAFYYSGNLLLMDEPLKSLDYSMRIHMIHYIITLWKDIGNSIIYVTHEIDEALLLADRIYVLSSMPTNVHKTIPITIKQQERNLKNKQLIDIRTEIIDLLCK